jgi:predicted nucleotidyltransferase
MRSILGPSDWSVTRVRHQAGAKPTASRLSGRLVVENMIGTLDTVLDTLRAHESELRRLGVSHATVFGSVARGEAGADSDIDVLVELDQDRSLGIFEYARLKLYINELLDGPSDVVNRRTLKPLLRDSILRDAVHAF